MKKLKEKTMSNKQSTKKIWEWTKLLLALVPVAVLFAAFTIVLVERFNLDVSINFWLLLAIWTFFLWLFVQPAVERGGVWDKVGYIWMYIWYGFWGTGLSLFFLSLLLQLTLEIDILEFDRLIYLTTIVWIGWIIGLYFYFKIEGEKQIQEQLDKLRRKETVYNPHPGLMERYAKEQKDSEESKKYTDKKPKLDSGPMSNLEKSDPDKNYMEYKERFSSMTDGQLMDAFNREVGNSGWTSSRGMYFVALREELEKRKIVLTSKRGN